MGRTRIASRCFRSSRAGRLDQAQSETCARHSWFPDEGTQDGFDIPSLLRRGSETHAECAMSMSLVRFLLDDPEPLLHHNEPIFRDGVRVGYIKAGGYGHTLGAAVGLGPVANEAGVTVDFVKWSV